MTLDYLNATKNRGYRLLQTTKNKRKNKIKILHLLLDFCRSSVDMLHMVSERVQPATWGPLRFFVDVIIVDYAVAERVDCCVKVIMVGA